ncbi:hypothetical protein VTO73DRAFT_9483 [Trametes versicolor]
MPRAPRPHSHAPRPRQTREAPVHLGYGYDNCVGNFLEEFSEAQSRKQRLRQHLTVDQLKVLRENADLVESILPPWADNTKFNVAGILKKWKRYCKEMGIPDWRQELRVAQKGTAISLKSVARDGLSLSAKLQHHVKKQDQEHRYRAAHRGMMCERSVSWLDIDKAA